MCASTLSMMAISVDRYLTIKNHRPAGQVVRRRYVLTTAVGITWFCAAIFSCTQLIPRLAWKRAMTLTRVILVHIIPALVVLISHLGVHSKLTALSLTARAKHGELPADAITPQTYACHHCCRNFKGTCSLQIYRRW